MYKSILTKGSAALLCSVFLSACGGSSSSGGDGGGSSSGTNISGMAEAPAGMVAQFENQSALYAISGFLFSPAHAAVTGLLPVTSATVDLIRIDDSGTQIGDVLATTSTSLSGDYTLTLPTGTDLSGDLIVRITGMGATTMSAQVVEQSVDINPVSEFVLAKFIDAGADLDNLTTAAVVKLTGDVEEFDLTAGADLSAMLAALEAETGDFVDTYIESATATPGDGATITGDYVLANFGFGLHDDDEQYGVGTFSHDQGIQELTITDAGAGQINLNFTGEESNWTNQVFIAGPMTEVTHNSEVELLDDTETVSFSSEGVISGTSAFEEDIDGDFGWRFAPAAFQLQKALNSNLFFGGNGDGGARYLTIDTNSDGNKDAIDPSAREGDEVFKWLDIIVKRPTALTTGDIDGTFGVVTVELDLANSGATLLYVDSSTYSFNGTSSVDVSATSGHELLRTYGSSVGYSASTELAEAGLAFTVNATGDILTFDGENVDGFINDSHDFLTFVGVDTIDDANTSDDQYLSTENSFTLGVKLPTSLLDIANKKYKPILLSTSLFPTETEVLALGFGSEIVVDATGTAATGTFDNRSITKDTMFADVIAESEDETGIPLSISVTADGSLTISQTDVDGTFSGDGYLSHDGSIGILHVRYADTGNDPSELGVMILLEVE